MALAVGGVTAKLPFRFVLTHARSALLVLAVLAVTNLLACLYIRPDGQWVIRMSHSSWQGPLQALICVLSPAIFASVLARSKQTDAERAVLITALYLGGACAGIAFMVGSMETGTISALTILAMAWMAGMSSWLAAWMAASVCFIGGGLILFSRPQLLTGDSIHSWTPVALSCASFARGGLEGIGLGGLFPDGTPQNFYDDFLFSVVGYELGSVGALLVLALFSLTGFFGFRLARLMRDPYARLCVAGTTTTLILSALAHMGSCLATIPAGRNWLPFLNGGGGPLCAAWASLGTISAAVQYDIRITLDGGEFAHGETYESVLWHPVRVRIIWAVFLLAIAILEIRVTSLAVDQDMARRFTEYIDQSLPVVEDPDFVPPSWAPRFEKKKKVPKTYQETRLLRQKDSRPVPRRNAGHCRLQSDTTRKADETMSAFGQAGMAEKITQVTYKQMVAFYKAPRQSHTCGRWNVPGAEASREHGSRRGSDLS